MSEAAIAYLGLGSNLGDRPENLQAARESLDQGPVRMIRCSKLYETQPVGGPDDQPWFLNQVAEVQTSLSPGQLLDRCMAIERALGRDRMDEERWGPRTVDIDLLVMGSVNVSEDGLVVPHPRLAARAFVLIPLAELAPDLSVPGLGRVDQLLKRCGDPHTVSAIT